MISKLRRLEVAQTAEDVIKGTAALPIDPIAIAKTCDILVQPMESKNAGISGFLMKQGNSFGIGYSTKLINQGFINFTVAHELGHYFLPGHPEKLFATGSGTHASHSGFIADDPCEQEADVFAATLLMPESLFRRAQRVAEQGFPAIVNLSQKCATSITATSIRFAEFSENAVAVVVSDNSAVHFCALSPVLRDLEGLTWMRRGDQIPSTSTTARFQRDPQNIVNSCQMEGCSMLDEWLDGAPRIEMKEDVVGLGHYGKTLTVLFTEEPVDSEDPEEEDSFDRWQRWEKRR